MDDPTRRRILGSAALLLGFGVGCQQLGDGADVRNPDESTSTSGSEGAVRDIYVEETMADLPTSVGSLAFGVTGEGLFRYDGDDGWTPVQYGSSRSPVPSMNATQATVGSDPSGRPLVSNGDRTMYVDPDGGSDDAVGTEDAPLATIQEALQRVPIYLRDQYVIDLATAADTPVSYDEDVLVPTVIGTGRAATEEAGAEPGPFLNLIIRGRQEDPEAVQVGSITFGNVVGTSAANLFYVTISRDSPHDDERTGLVAYGTGEVHLYGINFTSGPRNGLLSYGAKMKASVVDFGTDNVNLGIRGKRHASIIADRCTGATRSNGYLAVSNSKIGIKEGSRVEGNPTFETRVGGVIHDYNDDTSYGVGSASSSGGAFDASGGGSGVRAAADHPGDADLGELYYLDGSSDPDEGFYGQTASGPVRLG